MSLLASNLYKIDQNVCTMTPVGTKSHLPYRILIADSRFMCFMPSILATATMLHVIDEIEAFNPVEYQSQLMNVLKVSKVCT